jgi:hypothetical protein
MKKEPKVIPGFRTKKHLKIPKACGHRSKGYGEYKFDERKIHEGAKVEFEHTCNGELAERIAMDHIAEMGYDYYPELEKMEKKLLKRKENMPDKRVKKSRKKKGM